ncbi:MAG: SH3 domain-containing protein [Rhodospirillaceae bacterium]|nr:SH3 domain-containing protein [Rhodospirillaceae bacterium]
MLMLVSCANTAARFNDPTDVCNAQRQPLIRAKEQFSESIVATAGIGAAAGAAAGAGIALAAGGSTGEVIAGAVIGLVAGAAAGAAAGYVSELEQQTQDRQELLQLVNRDVAADGQRIGAFSSTVISLNNCRAQQLVQLRSQYESGAIDAATARARLAGIRANVQEDNDLVREVLSEVSERTDDYIEASATVQGLEADIVRGRYDAYTPSVTNRGGFGSGTTGGATTVRTIANLRAGPTTTSAVLGVVQPGQPVQILGDAGGGWSQVQVGGQQGYMASSLFGIGGRPAGQQALLPVVNASSRPTGATPVQENLIQTAEVRVTQDAQFDALNAEMDALEAFLAPSGSERDEEAI